MELPLGMETLGSLPIGASVGAWTKVEDWGTCCGLDKDGTIVYIPAKAQLGGHPMEELLAVTPQNFPPGTYIKGKKRIYRVVEWVSSNTVQVVAWNTTDPSAVRPDAPDEGPVLIAAPQQEYARITIPVAEQLLDAVTAEPATAIEIAERSPVLEGLPESVKEARAEAMLEVLEKDGKVTASADGKYAKKVDEKCAHEATDLDLERILAAARRTLTDYDVGTVPPDSVETVRSWLNPQLRLLETADLVLLAIVALAAFAEMGRRDLKIMALGSCLDISGIWISDAR